MTQRFPGEFEQMVLLAAMQLGHGAFALSILRELDARAGRRVSRGSLYKTLERLEMKGFITWSEECGGPQRGGHPRRRFAVTDQGIAVLKESRGALMRLWEGLEGVLGEAKT